MDTSFFDEFVATAASKLKTKKIAKDNATKYDKKLQASAPMRDYVGLVESLPGVLMHRIIVLCPFHFHNLGGSHKPSRITDPCTSASFYFEQAVYFAVRFRAGRLYFSV